ncbi:MAG: glycosyltransferase [Alphaproteobacteria bacterium]|jgi:hypothetical protein|nr:glycosyltransferase [Alphaproteobacteria bacterium]
MSSVKLSVNSLENPTWDSFLELAKIREEQHDPNSAFGYYVIAASLMPSLDGATAATLGNHGYRTGNITFAIQCFVIAAALASSPKEQKERQNAVLNLIKTTGVTVKSAELSPIDLDLPPLLEAVPNARPSKSETCLIIGEIEDIKENAFLSLSEDSKYSGFVFRYSKLARLLPMFNADRFLLYLARDLAPDIILFRHARLTLRALDPRVETFSAIRERANIPVAGIYFDLAKPSFERLCRSYLPGMDAIVPIDIPFNEKTTRVSKTAHLDGWTALPGSVYFDTSKERPIDVGFIGRTSAHYHQRTMLLQGLRDAGFNVEIRGKDNGGHLSVEEMGDFLRSCKIVINFSSTAVISAWELHDPEISEMLEVDHVKGRVFEVIACGAFLLESRNTPTTAFFTPDDHYAEFSGLEELIAKTRYYLDNEGERVRLANTATKIYQAKYTGKHFWRKFEAMMTEVSSTDARS